MGQSGCNVKLTTFFHLMPWLREQGLIMSVRHMFTWLAQGNFTVLLGHQHHLYKSNCCFSVVITFYVSQV